jgi:hypothetical protein
MLAQLLIQLVPTSKHFSKQYEKLVKHSAIDKMLIMDTKRAELQTATDVLTQNIVIILNCQDEERTK